MGFLEARPMEMVSHWARTSRPGAHRTLLDLHGLKGLFSLLPVLTLLAVFGFTSSQENECDSCSFPWKFCPFLNVFP